MGDGRPIKRHGVISCDGCCRDFDTMRLVKRYGDSPQALDGGWSCPRCGLDNASAMRERGRLRYRSMNRNRG